MLRWVPLFCYIPLLWHFTSPWPRNHGMRQPSPQTSENVMENHTLPLNNAFSNKRWLIHGYPPHTCTHHQLKTFSVLINQHIIIVSRKQESHYEVQPDLEILFFCLDLGSADITSIYHHIQLYMHGHGLINRKEVGRRGRNKAKRTIRSLVDVFLHAFSTWHLPRICFSCFCVNKINYLDKSFRVLLSVAGSFFYHHHQQ